MESNRLVSNSSVPVTFEDKKHKKRKGLMGTNPDPEEVIVKENGVRSSSVEIERVKDDLARIEAMTVQELRATLRSVGVPANGRKCDLVHALKCSTNTKLNGDCSLGVEELVSSFSMENISVKCEVQNFSNEDHDEDVNDDLEVPGLPQRKGRIKRAAAEGNTVRVNTKTVAKRQKLSIGSDKVSVLRGGKLSQTKRQVSSEIVTEVVHANEGVIPAIQTEPWTLLAHKKPQKGWIPYNPRTMRPPPLNGDTKTIKLMSWNVNGLRALLKLKGFSALQLSQREDFDILCLQETKLQEKDVENIKQSLIDGYENSFWSCSVSKLGYSGTAIISRSYRITEWDPSLSNYLKELEKSKPVILTGDLNCAHEEIDIFNPAGNKKSAGFTDEERQSFGTNLLSRGFVDTFRRQHPGVVGYTYWGYRHGGRKTNKGWRLDYFLVSESIVDKVHDSYILSDVDGSDHCPIGLVLKL